MKKFMFFIAAAVSLAAVGCSKDDAAPEQVQYVSELTLKFEGDTRMSASHYTNDGFSFEWEDEEVIYIYEYGVEITGEAKYYEYDQASGTFRPYFSGDENKMEVGKKYFAALGVQSVGTPVSLVDGKSVVKMQTSFDVAYTPLISDVFTADADGTVATMHHLAGVVEVPVKLSSSATITQAHKFALYVENAKMADSFTATPLSDNDYIKSKDAASDIAYSVNKKVTLYTGSTTSIFIPVLPGEYTNMKLYYYYYRPGDLEIQGTVDLSGKTLVVERGKITKISEVEVSPKLMGGK